MTNPQTVSESFIKWMESKGFGEFEKDIFLGQIPDTDDDDEPIDNAYWIITAGGDVTTLNVTKEQIQQFSIQVNYRNKSGEAVERNMFALNQQVNARVEKSFENFELHSIQASMPEDNDKDVENRPQALLVVAIEIYVS